MKAIITSFLVLISCLVLQAQTTTVTAKQSDQITTDAPPANKANPADVIRYKVDIQNTGANQANGLNFNAVIDPRTSFQGGSFRSTPLALPDAYACTGNVGINVPLASGVKANDFDDAPGGLTITAGTFATGMGGSIMLNADGSFMYTPPAGFTGTDTYSYTLNDGNPDSGVPTSDLGTITFTVSNLIWFIDNSAGAGDGRLNTPFNSLAAFNAGSAAAGDVVYLEHTGTDYTGGIVLANGERLFGEGHTGGANLSNVLPFSLAPFSKALPNINGSRPVITNAAGNGIALAQNNAVRGVNVANTTGADILGLNFGTLTLSEVALSGTGQALSLTTGTLAATFNGITTTSSTAQGILLSGVGGNLTAGGTTVSGSTTQGILVTGSTATVDFGNTTVTPGTDGVSLQNNSSGTRTFGTLSVTNGSGIGFLHGAAGGLTTITGATTITNPGGRGIDIQNSTAGNGVTFANVTATQSGGTGVFLSNNAGSITFAALNITPDANQRSLQATENSGTITATSGTISNSGAIGIDITKTSGATPLSISLTSVSASGSSNGIILSRTSGSFAINGSGSTNGSGGTISTMTARGASFTNSAGITLKNMTFTNANTTDAAPCGASDNSGCNAAIHLNTVASATLDNVDITTTAQQGINVRETSDFQLLNSTITSAGAGGQTEEAGLYGINLSGTAAITNTAISFPAERCAVIYNTGKTLNMTVSSSSFNDTQTSALGADGFEMTTNTGSITDLDITNCSFLRDKTNGVQFLTEGTGQGTVDITGCTVDPQSGVGVGLEVASNGTSVLKFNIFNNPSIKGRLGTVLNCFAQGNSTMEGQVSGNTVSSLAGAGSGIRAVASADGDVKIKILNNTVSNIAQDNGIVCTANSGTGRMDATITGNNVSVLTSASFDIMVAAGASSSTFTNKLCANVANNTVSPAPISGNLIANFQGRAATATHELLLQGPSPITNYWDSKGNTPTSATATVQQSGLGTFTYNATCLLPSYP